MSRERESVHTYTTHTTMLALHYPPSPPTHTLMGLCMPKVHGKEKSQRLTALLLVEKPAFGSGIV